MFIYSIVSQRATLKPHSALNNCITHIVFILSKVTLHFGNNDIREIFRKSCIYKLAALAQMVACLPLVQQVRGSIPGGVVNFHLKFFNLGARRGGDAHFLIARLYITALD